MFDMGDLKQGIVFLPDRMKKSLMGFGNTAAKDLQGKAQSNRPWTDRTGHARQRLKGYCTESEDGLRIYLAHGVDYGVKLEFGYEKRYAIIYPTLRKCGPEIMAGCRKILRGR
ncbi:hypothetical protein LQE92_08845 [Lacrimispora sp. NSJ-141]|uniref:Uncharacterized protein n=1 Tax=Lientehia hominis TaxID=2897778 RepID=A0AAP2RIA5_9FIRM|nr:hypothetical protein [Lientehia hominis]MCD2492734.1 hypothetical protein [Lientehia hominis]